MSGTLADLHPTPEDLAELAEVLSEVEAESYGPAGLDAYSYDDAGPDGLDYGDPDDPATYEQAALSSGGYDVLSDITASIELANQRALARQALERQPLPRRSEDRMAALLARAAAGSYDLSQPQEHGCGPLDEFGRCAGRYHDGGCFETYRGEVATGSARGAEAWRATLLANHQAAIELANAQGELDREVDGALAGPDDAGTYHAMRAVLGLG